MTSAQRFRKRSLIVTIVIFFLTTVGTGIYLIVRPAATCHDGKKNQNEAGVDCGGVCGACSEIFNPEAFIIRESAFVPGGNPGEYDVLVRVNNPNDELGASELTYEFRLLGSDGTVLATATGKGFILPQETKTFLSVNLRSAPASAPASVAIAFSGMTWQRFSGYQEKPAMSVVDKRYQELSNSPFFGEATGTLMNDSAFDFHAITLKVVLRDDSGKPVALNQTEMDTVLAKENREFILRWPKPFPGHVARVDVEPDVDFFRVGSFVERYHATEVFQNLR
ncbi:MAG: hypothetical protein HGA31_04255 [Candidatus Moranbacteria bacterium]|nr:hypothetical protein [Candidatus Moranbacteria bacterium]